MTPADLALHYSADELLAALCAKMDPASAVAAVRAVAPFLSAEDKAARARRLGAERSRRSYQNRQISDGEQRQTPDGQQGQAPSVSHAEPSETGGNSDGASSAADPSPSVSLPGPLPSTPPPTPSPARIREDADILTAARQVFQSPEILDLIPGWIDHCREHAEERGKAFTLFTARMQFQELARMGPAKALLAIQSSAAKGSASIIDPDEKRFGGANGHANGSNRPRAEPDTTPLAVDSAVWRAFVTSPDYPEYHSLTSQPAPKTEADIAVGVKPDWKNFKRSRLTPK